MAWIKIETNLFEKPEVVWLSKALKVKPIVVVGALVRFWSVVDGLTEDGAVALYDGGMVDEVVEVKGFAEGMVKVGWLEICDGGIVVPEFDKHNGSSAKRRAEAARSMNALRARRRLSGKAGVLASSEQNCQQVLANSEHDCAQVTQNCGENVIPREEKRRGERLSCESLSARAHARGALPKDVLVEVPGSGEVEQYGVQRGWPVEEVQKWLLWQRQNGWRGRDGRPIMDWRASLELWMMRAEDFDGGKNGRAGGDDGEVARGRSTEDGVDMSLE